MNFVYLASDEVEYGPLSEISGLPSLFRVKIGRTRDPAACLLQLRRGNPDIEFLHLWFVPYRATKVESSLHRRYSRSRVRGEFFLICIEELALLLSIPANEFGDAQLGYLPRDIPEPRSYQ